MVVISDRSREPQHGDDEQKSDQIRRRINVAGPHLGNPGAN
jgi:hypothetical protein